MRIENKLILAQLKQNRGRSVITVLGITLAVAMFTAVVCAGASFLSLLEDYAVTTYGNYHFYVDGSDAVETIKNNENVDDYCYEYDLPTRDRGFIIKEGKAKHSSVGDWQLGDEKYFQWMVQKSYIGRLPKNPKEIVLSKGVINENGLDWKIGDTVSLTTVWRVVENDHIKTEITGAYSYEETDIERYTDSYKIVGIINTDELDMKIYRYPAENDWDEARTYVRMKKLSPATTAQIFDIFRQLGIDTKKYGDFAGINETLLLSHLSLQKTNTTAIGTLSIFASVIAVIMLCAVVLIYNAFSMSYAERVQYLGMLSSVGATRKQKMKSTYFEAFVLGGTGIAAGFIAGIIVTKLAVTVMSKMIIDAGIFGNVNNIKLNLVVSGWACLAILILSVITILIAVYKPAVKASYITPINAIRLTEEYKAVKKSGSPKILKKLLGYESVLAYKNQRRNGRKGRVIIASIAITVALVIVCNYACDIAMQYLNINGELPYQVYASHQATDHTEFEKYLSELEYVDRFYYDDLVSIFLQDYEGDGSTAQEISAINSETLTKKYKNLTKSNVSYNVFAIMDKDFDDYCRKNNIDPIPYYELDGRNMKCVVMNNINHKKNSAPVFSEKLLGESIYEYYLPSPDISQEELKELDEAAFPHYVFTDFGEYDEDNYMCHLSIVNSVSIFVPHSVYEKFFYVSEDNYTENIYGIETKEHKKLARELGYYFESFPQCNSADDVAERLAMVKTVTTVARLLLYSLILLIVMIIIFNIINTISTSMLLRGKELSMLLSVGLTPKGIRKMLFYEGIFNVSEALMLGLPTGTLLNLLINRILGDGKIPYEINIWLYLIVSAVAIIIVLTTIYFSCRTIKKLTEY